MKRKQLIPGALLAFSVLALPGCKWFSGCSNKQECSEKAGCLGDQASGEVLLSIEGSPALTVKDIDTFIDQIAGADEQVKSMLQNPEYKERIFQDKKRAIVLGKWAKDAGVREKKEYKDKEKNVLEAVRTQLDAEEFVKHHSIDVSDSDAKKYYDESKNQDPRILISPAGVKSAAVVFDSQSAANDFAKKLKDSKAKDIEKMAKEQKLTVLPLGVVNEEAFFVDAKVKEKIMATRQTPEVIVVKGDDNKYWVVVAQKKETAQYRPFDKIKDTIKQALKAKKTEEVFENELKKIEQKLNIVENKQYFQDLKQTKAPMMQNPMLAEEPSADKELAGSKVDAA